MNVFARRPAAAAEPDPRDGQIASLRHEVGAAEARLLDTQRRLAHKENELSLLEDGTSMLQASARCAAPAAAAGGWLGRACQPAAAH